MLVNRLAFVIVFRGIQQIGSGNGLRRLICFKAFVQYLLSCGLFRVAVASISQHQLVVGKLVFWVDTENLLKGLDRLFESSLKKMYTANFSEDDTIPWILCAGNLEVGQGFVIAAESPKC